MTLPSYRTLFELVTQIIQYRVSRMEPALADLKVEVDLYHCTGKPMPYLLRQFAHTEMQRDTPYQMPKGQGRKPSRDVILRNNRYSQAVEDRQEGMGVRDAFEKLTASHLGGADEGFTADEISEYRKADQRLVKMVAAELCNILDQLPEAEREEILADLPPGNRELLYPQG